jgi:hypothetical protein
MAPRFDRTGKFDAEIAAVSPQLRGPILATDVLYGFPFLECCFDCQKIPSIAVVRVLLDSGASPCEPPTACRSNGSPRELPQRSRELTMKRRNVVAATHVIYHRLEYIREFASRYNGSGLGRSQGSKGDGSAKAACLANTTRPDSR